MSEAIAAARATADALYGRQAPSLQAANEVPVLYPSGRPRSDAAERYLQQLTLRANDAAGSVYCGSILAGWGSDTDEFGDVAVWLGQGDYGRGNEHRVLGALKLPSSSQTKILPVGLSPSSRLPEARKLDEVGGEIEQFVRSLSRLQDAYCFRAEHLPGLDGLVIFVLLGHCEYDSESDWVGLVGVGVWT